MSIIFFVSALESGGATRGDSVMLVPTFSGGGAPFYTLHVGVELRYLAQLLSESNSRGKRYLARIQALRQLIRQKKPDVIVSFMPNVNIAALAATAPCIVCERSYPVFLPIGWVWRGACNLLYRYADLVCVQTHAVAANIHQVYGGLKNVEAVPNPLPTDLLRWQARGPDSDRKILLSVGRLAEEKRVGSIIDTFSKLAPDYPDWDLHLYGDGPQRTALHYQVEELGLQERAFLEGRTAEPWKVMANADAFVMASHYEGFPSGPREMSREGKDALLVGVDDKAGLRNALAQLMSDGVLRQTLGQRARASVVERYALDSVLKAWDSLFTFIGQKTRKELD